MSEWSPCTRAPRRRLTGRNVRLWQRSEWIHTTKSDVKKKMTRVHAVSLFFFQAEDGIRDLTVTGVQTCALPICADELGPVIPRTFPPAPGWSPDGHRIKAPLEYSRGPEKTWVYGGLRVADGQAVPLCAPARNNAFYQDFLPLEEPANPEGTKWAITGNLTSHHSK